MSDIYLNPILITEEYLKAYSPIPNNFDWSDLRPFISIAESVHIVPIIGKALHKELLDQIVDNEVTDINSTLLLKIYPLLSMAVVYEAAPFLTAHISAKGISKGKSDNADSIDFKELNDLQNHIKSELAVLKTQLKEWLDEHNDCYPLYPFEDCCCKKPIGDIRLYPNTFKHKHKNL